MNSTVSALESLDISYQYISFSPKQKMLLEQTAKAVDGDAALSGRFHKDGLSLRMQDDCSEPRDPLSDNTHPAYQLSPTERGLYPALLLLSATQSLAEAYRLRGIPRQVLVDTLSDIPLWMNNCETHFGYQGMLEFPWLSNHMRMRLFRLGRLEFEKLDSPWELSPEKTGVRKGEKVISIHSPQGEKLAIDRVKESLILGMDFWGRDLPYLCHSWLLYPGLRDILPQNSNIIQFQNEFQLAETDFNEREAEWRIFGKTESDPQNYPEETSLQKNAKKYLLSGRKLGNGLGILKRNN